MGIAIVIGHIRLLPTAAALATTLLAAGCGGHEAAAPRTPVCDTGGLSDTGPAWSPDGRSIAFRRDVGGKLAIFTIPASGGRATRLTPPGRYGFLAWSPDGRRLTLPVLRASGKPQVLVIDVRTRRTRAVAAGDAAGGRPFFSPDGRSLVIVQSHRERRSIGVVASTGGAVHRLTPLAEDDFEPVWSPDGRRIAYVHATGGRSRIWIVDRSGLNRHPLTGATGATQETPAWSADGQYVAFVAVTGPFSAAVELATVATGTTQTIARGGTGYDLAFAPRSAKLAYVEFGQNAGSKLYVTDTARHAKPVEIDAHGFQPSWSPDGRRLVRAHELGGYASRLRIGTRSLTCSAPS